MNRKLIGYRIGSFGLGVVASAIIYPLGYLESEKVFYVMTSVGIALIIIGSFFKPSKNEKDRKNSN
ncbi:hypothetical protein BHF71_10785 [Vulcanibacillus modesticaldus]|uniref:Uncharacterized protein n=1 Tax=Vulcanibacillus modesticaldus TaxID=337097 RepID=A0A1D2YT12_9BACI|nr:hypothetical protein [Vulcanibacillus modesticaldus]OEF98828.1 hypothetical protein BHF71_10785 [Vulcanibacillus modesticaldus]